MFPKALVESGAEVVEPVEYHPGREKVYGRMWENSTKLKKGNTTYHLSLWHHGGDTMTEGEALSSMAIKGIEVGDKWNDPYWTTVMSRDAIYLHPKGWFNDRELEAKVKRALGKSQDEWMTNTNTRRDKVTPAIEKRLLKLGFKKIASRRR